MRMRVRPMGPKDVNQCAALLASHPEEQRLYGALLRQLPSAWLKLLRARSMIAALIEDIDCGGPQLVACGASVFVTDVFLHCSKTAPLVWLGPELVRRALAGDPAILSLKGIRKANSGDGLNVMVWAGLTCARRPEERRELYLEVNRAFFDLHTGYRLKEIVVQPHDIEVSRMVLNTGVLLWQPPEGCYSDGQSHQPDEWLRDPFILGSTRELAYERGEGFGSWLSTLFSYTPPKIFFGPAEQRLLLAALRGLTDERLAS